MSYKNVNTLGQHGFFFFFGVVEDRQDPMGIGRVRVRCHGLHNPSKVDIPTEHLPWASVVVPTTENESSTPDLKIGCNVFGFFVDGEEMQVPMILGVVPGIIASVVDGNAPVLPSPTKANEIGSTSLSGCSTGINRPTKVAKSSPITGMPIIGNEPSDPYAATYPYNHTRQSESGHVIELDDTPDKERVHIFHRAGSFVEMHPDGTVVMKSIGDSYELSAKGKNIYAKGDVNIVAGGTLNIWAESNVNITPNDTVVITGDLKVTGEVTVDGNVLSKSDVRTQTVSLNLHKHQGAHGITTEPIPTWQ
jgi:hypothetical protein